MGDIVNLNKYRKQKAKAERDKLADQNRRLHGRTKLERSREELQKQNLTRGLEGNRLERQRDLTSADDPSDADADAQAHSEETESD
jgi:uncharacterized protein DUF4169